jgi:hypothetical protein
MKMNTRKEGRKLLGTISKKKKIKIRVRTYLIVLETSPKFLAK